MTSAATPRPLLRSDAGALIGLLAVPEVHVLSGDLAPAATDALARRLSVDGAPELRVALTDLNRRLRYALGEHDEPPTASDGRVDVRFGFLAQEEAQAFAGSVPGATSPEPVDGGAYDGDIRRQVGVRSAALPLSAEFDAEVGRLGALAAQHSGTYGGWATKPR